MQTTIKISVFLFIIFLPGCLNSGRQEFYSYRQSPEFIKKYINGLFHGQFLIAEKGEHWEAGCELRKGEKCFQFISASMDSTQYKLNFFGGGIAGRHQETIIINFQGNKVTSYGFGSKPNEFKQAEAND